MSRRIQSSWEKITGSTQVIQKRASVSCLTTDDTDTTDNESSYDENFFVCESDGTKRKVKQAHGSFADDVEQNID